LPEVVIWAVLLSAHVAAAQAPAPSFLPESATPAPPLAQIKDDKQLAEALQSITQDPTIAVEGPVRPLAQALMTEGVKQLKARAYDQALANFFEAYAKFPSPTILLHIASTLRDMGRLADAANTYQRYLTDPAIGSERIAGVKELLRKLDHQLTILSVEVMPHGSDISIDGGPFIPVGSSLVTRVRSGLHLVRIRQGDQSDELTINGFEGEHKDVSLALPAVVAPEPARPAVVDPRAPEIKRDVQKAAPERVEGWLITGTLYGAGDATSRARTVHDHTDGHLVTPIVPHGDPSDRGGVAATDQREDPIDWGVLGVLRIDGKGRGFAGGAGLAISRGNYGFEIMMLKSDVIGGYLGGRYWLLTGVLRPYIAVGAPGFVFDHDEPQSGGTTMTTRRLSVGVRAAAGIELVVSGHFSVQGDLGYEHFFFLDDTDPYETDVFVPTLGVIGRL
jgi:hypothetical protein